MELVVVEYRNANTVVIPDIVDNDVTTMVSSRVMNAFRKLQTWRDCLLFT